MLTDPEFAALAYAAYTSDPTVVGQGIDQTLHAVITDQDDGSAVVAFRGTKEPLDWVIDLDAQALTVPGYAQLGLVHGGFVDGALDLLPALVQVLARRPYSLTGHSLGGALAIDTGALLKAGGYPPTKIVTFGCPRCGMSDLTLYLQDIPIVQYLRGNDPIPSVPPDLMQPWIHAREPLVHVGQPQLIPIECHFMTGYLQDVTEYCKGGDGGS